MQSLDVSITRVAAYFWGLRIASEYQETTGYGLESVDRGYAPLKELYQAAFRGHDVL